MRYKLQVFDEAEGQIGGEWILHLPAVVGRSPDADVPIGEPSISRRHCQFFLNGEGALSVRDFESTNGTYVGGQRITRAVLTPGELVRIGSISLKLEWTDEPVTGKKTFGQTSVSSTQPMRIISKEDYPNQ